MAERFKAWCAAVLHTLFVDVPFLIDSAWRRLDLRINSEYAYAAGDGARLEPVPCWRRLPFWLFSITLVFIAYGPTLAGFCTIAPYPVSGWLLGALGVAGVAFSARLGWSVKQAIGERVDRRLLEHPQAPWMGMRRFIASAAMWGCAAVVVLPALLAPAALVYSMWEGGCSRTHFSWQSVVTLSACIAAIAAFAALCARTTATLWLLAAQAGLIAALAALQWLWLAPAEATEASGSPYRHVFGALAPAVCVLLCLSPWIARWRIRTLEGSAQRFRNLLARQEVFVSERGDPSLSAARIFHAFFHGAAYRVLQLALPPALMAFAAHPDWLPTFTGLGLFFALSLSTWGNLSSRWQHMVRHVERWFLTGLPLFVSLFVIVIAALRLLGVHYVTTILDAAPFGALFGLVIMCYVFAWLIEYWVNRAAEAELLRLLGAAPGELSIVYSLDERTASAGVKRTGRFIMGNGLGRFMAVGTQLQRDETAFHSYGMLELFRLLSSRQSEERNEATEVSRQTEVYFFIMNIGVALLIGGFALYGWLHMSGRIVPDAVVVARADPDPAGLHDLAARLIAPEGDHRPALIVAASGGGTRAALYTAHVLEGLHRLGADKDVVLASGVSGGGVALAYFTANYTALTNADAEDSEEWRQFRSRVSRPFIQDVIEGASEWRIFGRTPLSVLLSESFERRLMRRSAPQQQFVFEGTPVLILNTAVAGHPAEDSEVLAKTLDRAGGAPDCVEEARPYRQLQGGRLIFTNLKNISAFPQGRGPVPDVRLPYRIVRDTAVPLARAAALNANFPPAFPNARVVLRNAATGTQCHDREYFVTDGGVEENLGLVSALYAVQSALLDARERCAANRCRLRPIHFVLAEASAASYDYTQDRGFSAAVDGAKERVTGGLTNELIAGTRRLYEELAGANTAEKRVVFNYLALPLVFRARGGFGTHWMHAAFTEMSDPRLRAPAGLWHLPFGEGDPTVTVSRRELGTLWKALFDPSTDFCSQAPESSRSRKIREWICGTEKDAERDLQPMQWRALRAQLKAY